MQKTTMATNEACQAARKWYEIDATGVTLGKLAVKVADLLRGKTKVNFTPNQDCGDYVIVRNAKKVNLTGNKETDKIYYNHSLWVGSLRQRTAGEMKEKFPEEMIFEAVKGMVPHNRLGRKLITKLFVYPGEGVSHEAQKPEKITV